MSEKTVHQTSRRMRVLEMVRPTCNSSSILNTIPFNPINFSFILTNRTHKILKTNSTSSLSLHSNASSNIQFSQGRPGFSIHATKKRSKSKGSPLEMGMEDFDDEDEDDEEEGMIIPFEGMRKWEQNKPAGFGVGKEYDTSIEDKLVEEIEQSRRAQIANINKLKSNPPSTSSKEKQKGLEVGKEYDTSIEDKLVEEIEQSRRAQIANINKLKSNPPSTSSKEQQKAPEVFPSGIRVRVGNLPKKKNIHKDLQLAFKGFPGIVNISPAVSGNKKTREPVCKGFAFVYVRSEEVANRFVQTYSKQSIAFGKIEKQITCEMINPRESSDSTSELAAEGSNISKPTLGKIQKKVTRERIHPRESSGSTSELAAEGSNISKPALGEIQKQVNEMINPSKSSNSTLEPEAEGRYITNPAFNKIQKQVTHDSSDAIAELAANGSFISNPELNLPSSEESLDSEFDDSSDASEVTSIDESIVPEDPSVSANWKEIEVGIKHLNLLEPNGDGNQRPRPGTKTDSLPLKQQSKSQKVKKKLIIKGKKEKSPKLNVPGSAKRLKVKEKAVMAGALSRYGSEASLASRRES